MKQCAATADDHGKRLDVFVAEQLPRLSRSFVRKLCEQGSMTVNGTPAKPGIKLRAGDKIAIDYDETALDRIPAIDLPVLYEDENCVVINKPAGVLTHAPNELSREASVATFLRGRIADSVQGSRGGIVHRLDRATSGVIICAKNPTALAQLQKQFSRRTVKKTYIALVEGRPDPPAAVIDMPVERNPKAPATFRVGANGKPAVTHYRTLQTAGGRSLLELTPATGRTHQLRVHLARLGHPIVGDPLYGHGTFGGRLFLHALSLEITLPGGDRRIFTAPLPPEFEQELGRAR